MCGWLLLRLAARRRLRVVRWAIMAETAWLPAMVAIEPLHGLTFALLHLTCLRLLAESVPHHLAATALTIYGTVGIGVPTALPF
jgi:PPP family 3-phenylpropionic acid transporter